MPGQLPLHYKNRVYWKMRKAKTTRQILPACLLVAGRPCLVVGGGQVATRKVGHLLDAGADVLVVAMSLTAELESLAASGRITVARRRFIASDVRNKCVVFATTNSKTVNRSVLAACRKHRVTCSASDSNSSRVFSTDIVPSVP